MDDKVVDSREARTGDLIRRRRECLKCSRRFTTYERIDEIPYMVIKKDGRREKFERHKLLQGLLKACEKRPVPVAKLEAIVDETEAFVSEASQYIWLSAYASNNPTSDYHWMASACYYEAQRRDDPGLYQQAYDRAR